MGTILLSITNSYNEKILSIIASILKESKLHSLADTMPTKNSTLYVIILLKDEIKFDTLVPSSIFPKIFLFMNNIYFDTFHKIQKFLYYLLLFQIL